MRAHISPLKGKKKEKISSYTSPFVAKAQAKALERAREARKHLPRHGFVRNEWDTTPKQPGGLFDPMLKKKEIFKLEPRQSRGEEGNSLLYDRSHLTEADSTTATATTNANATAASAMRRSERDSSRLTMRTQESVPRRRPLSASNTTRSHHRQSHDQHPKQQQQELQQPHHSHHTSHPSSRSPSPPPPPPPPLPVPSSSSSNHHPRGDQKEETPHAPILSSRDPYPLRPSSGSVQLDEREQQARDAAERRYGDLIRERLRTLLYDRIGLREGDDRKRVLQRVRPPYYTYQDPQQAFTRDMMANMANIMQAVGTIVSGVNESKKPRRRRLFSRSRPISPSPYLSPDVLFDERDQHLYSQPRPPKPPQQEVLSPAAPAAREQVMTTAGGGNGENWAWQVSQAIQEKKRLPKSKSGVLDMVLAKLQAIEESEREIALYLKQQHATSAITLDDEQVNKEVTLVVKKSKGKVKLTKELLEAATADPDLSHTPPPTKTKLNKIEFPKLTAPNDQNNDTYRYMEELRSARRLRELAYEARSSSLSQTVTTITDILADRMIGSVVKDLETIMEDCSEGVLKTV